MKLNFLGFGEKREVSKDKNWLGRKRVQESKQSETIVISDKSLIPEVMENIDKAIQNARKKNEFESPSKKRIDEDEYAQKIIFSLGDVNVPILIYHDDLPERLLNFWFDCAKIARALVQAEESNESVLLDVNFGDVKKFEVSPDHSLIWHIQTRRNIERSLILAEKAEPIDTSIFPLVGGTETLH